MIFSGPVIEARAADVIVGCAIGWDDVFVVETAWKPDNSNVARSSLQFASTSCAKFGIHLGHGRAQIFHLRLGRFDEGQMWDWLDEFFTWVRVVLIIAIGPVILILSLVNGLWGYAIFGALFTIFGAFVAKLVFGK